MRLERLFSADDEGSVRRNWIRIAAVPFRARMSGFSPKLFGLADRIHPPFPPPTLFITNAVQCAVVSSTERNDPLVAHLASQCSGLGET